ncbi:Pol [Symbiodinium sp. CCMP2592]|nr:Pol [Symbiodinium sp. CCMP2592]
MLAPQHGPRLVWFGLWSICLRSSATDVQWQISIAWEDENCDAVCASNGLACTEACWPNTARGLENALRSSGLHSTCFGVEAGSPNPWHPAKDPENTMCYWFGGHTASEAPRCPLTPATPAAMLENSRVIRRLCPCISGNSTYGWLDCGLDGEPMDPAPTALGWIDDRAATTTSQPTPIIIPPGEQQPAPAPPQVMPGVPACQELCVAGFAGEDEFLNGRYVRLNGESGRLAFWSKFGGLPDLSDGRLQRGGDGVWRYYSVSSRANTSIGEGTLKTAESDIPQDDYVLTPTGGYQVEYQCCPQTSQSPTILGGQEDTRTPAVQDTLMRPIMAALIGGAALLCVLPAIVFLVYRWRPRVLRKRAYQEFQSEQSKGSATVSRDPEKDLTGKMSRLAEQAHAKQAMMPAAAGLRAKASVPTSAPSADGMLLPNTLLPNPKKGTASASAVADVLGKSSTMSQEGIYEVDNFEVPGSCRGASSAEVGIWPAFGFNTVTAGSIAHWQLLVLVCYDLLHLFFTGLGLLLQLPVVESPPPVQPSPEQLGIPDGVFETEGKALKQISLLEVGLGLLVLGAFDLAATTLKHTPVRFRAFVRATDEPILLSALLLQIGDKWVGKAVPSTTVNLDLTPSAVLRVAVYRDEWEGPWSLMTQKPIRAILEVVAPLRTCSRVGCTCDEWHGVAAPGDPPALLEVWARAFLSGTFKVVSPSEAVLFNTFVRVPVSLVPALLRVAGRAGVYFEPRAVDSRAPSPEYQVFWMAKASKQEVVVAAQSQDKAIGIARIGPRFGLRCLSEHAEALHGVIKPGTPYVDRQTAKLFHTGPWPFGTQRRALASSLKDWGWHVKPMQPVPGQERLGVWWAVQATEAPPAKVLQLNNAEVLVVEVKPATAKPDVPPQVIATKAVCRSLAVQNTSGPDPLQEDDPWASALRARAHTAAAPAAGPGEATKAMEARLQAQIKAQMEEVSKNFSGRVQSLEVGVQKLEVGFSAVSSKVDQQETRLTEAMNQLFERQTLRIEELLAPKRARRVLIALPILYMGPAMTFGALVVCKGAILGGPKVAPAPGQWYKPLSRIWSFLLLLPLGHSESFALRELSKPPVLVQLGTLSAPPQMGLAFVALPFLRVQLASFQCFSYWGGHLGRRIAIKTVLNGVCSSYWGGHLGRQIAIKTILNAYVGCRIVIKTILNGSRYWGGHFGAGVAATSPSLCAEALTICLMLWYRVVRGLLWTQANLHFGLAPVFALVKPVILDRLILRTCQSFELVPAIPQGSMASMGSLLTCCRGFTVFVSGPPVLPRARSSVTGQYSGVGFLSSFPARAAPHAIDPEYIATSRIHLANFFVGAEWMLGAVVYGFPVQPSATEQLLHAVTERILSNGVGPRFIAGDFNIEPHALTLMPLWRRHGFVEIQDLWHARHGVLPVPTCKRKTRKDFLLISPELQELLLDVQVDDTWFADHSLLLASFRITRPSGMTGNGRPSGCVKAKESHSLNRACGRAATKTAVPVKTRQCPVHAGRNGECSPGYFGHDRTYAAWFRQLRRLQSLVHALRKHSPTDGAVEYRAGLWHSIISATGFRHGFRAWWPLRKIRQPSDPDTCPATLPALDLAQALLDSFQRNVAQFERDLQRDRRQAAAARRASNPSVIFQDLKKEQAQPVDTLVLKTVAVVSEVCHEDSHLKLKSETSWRSEQGFFLNGRPLEVFHAEPDVVWASTEGVQAGDVVSQERPLASLHEVFQAFADEWQKRWLRHENVDPATWRALTEGVALPALRSYPWRPLSAEEWMRAVRAKHCRSATGPDGVSKLDLLALTPPFVDRLLGIVARAEETGRWPQQMLNATVASVEKVPEAEQVSQFRPICVLPLPYRTWSSLRARTALKFLSELAPAELTGGMPGKSATGVWYDLQLALEEAHDLNRPLVGALFDLSKAFNTLPRTPIFAMALRLGFPEALVRAWSGAVTCIARRFKVRGATGPPILSVTGFPEGCAMSCVAMAIVDLALHWHVARADLQHCLTSFVDDWQVRECSPARVQLAVAMVTEFVRGWDLTMDPRKTVFWASRADHRRQLRRQGLPVENSVRNVGGHVSFNRRCTNATVQARIEGLEGLWPRLAASWAPRNQKVMALKVAAWPAALHGISGVCLSLARFAALRSAAVQGLRLDRPGLNPMIYLGMVEFPLADPHFFAIWSTFRDLRVHAARDSFVPLLASLLSKEGSRTPGPAGVFLERVALLGWRWDIQAEMIEDSISCFDPWAVSPQELLFRLTFAWQRAIGVELEKRDGFQGLSQADPGETRRLQKNFAAEDRLNLALGLSGAFYTQDALHHFSDNPDDDRSCRFCGQADGVKHRVWYCPHFRERCGPASFPDVDVATLAPAQSLRGWAMRPRGVLQLWRKLAALPDRSATVLCEAPAAVELDLFTDGSCKHPAEPNLRLASWAVIIAAVPGTEPITAAGAALPGVVQTAFRAEITAVIAAFQCMLQWQRPARIWSDCAGVVRCVLRIQKGTFRCTPSKANFDLWNALQELARRVPPGWTVHKVAAHVATTDRASMVDDWACWNNQAADREALRTNMDRPPSFWLLWREVCRDQALQTLRGRAVLHRLRAIARVATQPEAKADNAVEEAPARVPALPDLRLPLPRALERYGAPFVLALHAWLGSKIRRDCPGRWIPFLHLYLLFEHQVGIVPPVFDKTTRTWKTSRRGDFSVGLLDLPERVRLFRQQVRALIAQVGGFLQAAEVRPFSATLLVKLPSVYIPWSQEEFDLLALAIKCRSAVTAEQHCPQKGLTQLNPISQRRGAKRRKASCSLVTADCIQLKAVRGLGRKKHWFLDIGSSDTTQGREFKRMWYSVEWLKFMQQERPDPNGKNGFSEAPAHFVTGVTRWCEEAGELQRATSGDLAAVDKPQELVEELRKRRKREVSIEWHRKYVKKGVLRDQNKSRASPPESAPDDAKPDDAKPSDAKPDDAVSRDFRPAFLGSADPPDAVSQGPCQYRALDESEFQRFMAGENLSLVSAGFREDDTDIELPSQWQSKLSVIKKLGEGSFGKVFQCRVLCETYKEIYVSVKLIVKKEPIVRKEIQVLEGMRGVSDYCISAVGEPPFIDNRDGYWIMMPYMNGGELHDFLAKCRRNGACIQGDREGRKDWTQVDPVFTTSYLLGLFHDMVAGVQALHEKAGLLHIDLKPANVMLNCEWGNKRPSSRFRV